MSYYVYLIAACACFVGEMFTMEFSLTCLGIGLLGAAYTSFIGYGIWWQTGVFAVVAVVAWLSVRPLALKYLYRNVKSIKTPAQTVIGQQAVVDTDIPANGGFGRVKVNGENWRAVSAEPLAKGTLCRVEKLDGVTLFVKKI